MPPDADDDLASDRALADAIIRDAFRRDADRVVAVVAEVIERLKAKRGYSAQELEAAAQALLDELSAPPCSHREAPSALRRRPVMIIGKDLRARDFDRRECPKRSSVVRQRTRA